MNFANIGNGIASGSKKVGKHILDHKVAYGVGGTASVVGGGLFVKSAIDEASAKERAFKNAQLSEFNRKMRNGVY